MHVSNSLNIHLYQSTITENLIRNKNSMYLLGICVFFWTKAGPEFLQQNENVECVSVALFGTLALQFSWISFLTFAIQSYPTNKQTNVHSMIYYSCSGISLLLNSIFAKRLCIHTTFSTLRYDSLESRRHGCWKERKKK